MNLFGIIWKNIKIGRIGQFEKEKQIKNISSPIFSPPVLSSPLLPVLFPPIEFNGIKMLVKGFTNPYIPWTYDMSIFKKFDCNRPEENKGVKKIINSALNIGCWVIPFVIVTDDMRVQLGQHTVIAAEILHAPVYIITSVELTPEEIIAREICTRWTGNNALQTYAATKMETAENLLNLFNNINISLKNEKKGYRKLTIPQLLAISYKNPHYIGGLATNGGITLFKTLAPYNMLDEKIYKIAQIFAHAQKNCMPIGITIRPQYISMGILKFIFDNEATIDLDKLLNKLNDDFHFTVAVSPEKYCKQLQNLYK